MKESDLNLLIKNNMIQQGGWAEKIPDPAGIAAKMAIKNPFDGFAFTPYFDIVWESKFKYDYSSFNFSTIREHQIANLQKIKQITKCRKETTKYCLVILGIFLPHKSIDLFLFDIDYITNMIKNGKKSILKKELLNLVKEEKYISIKNKNFDIKLIKEKVIYN